MIISASRRTDIPALYPEWFVNRLKAGEVLVPNPYNRKKVSRTSNYLQCRARRFYENWTFHRVNGV